MSEIFIPVGPHRVAAWVQPAQHARGTIVFVHGSGVDRHDAGNQFIAERLRAAGFGSVLFDLLEPQEALERHNVFDVELQAARLLEALDELQRSHPLTPPHGYFCTGVGAGVALVGAAQRPAEVAAIVARSGRPDKASAWLHRVQAPTLLIVERPDEWNDFALERLRSDKALAVVPRAPRGLEEVAEQALHWFSRYLVSESVASAGAASS